MCFFGNNVFTNWCNSLDWNELSQEVFIILLSFFIHICFYSYFIVRFESKHLNKTPPSLNSIFTCTEVLRIATLVVFETKNQLQKIIIKSVFMSVVFKSILHSVKWRCYRSYVRGFISSNPICVKVLLKLPFLFQMCTANTQNIRYTYTYKI